MLTEAGLKIQLHPNGTAIEGEWEPVFAAIETCHQAEHAMGCPRVYTNVKVHTRTDQNQTLLLDQFPRQFWLMPLSTAPGRGVADMPFTRCTGDGRRHDLWLLQRNNMPEPSRWESLGRVLLRSLRIGASTVSIVELLRSDWTGGISGGVAWLVFVLVERRLPPLSSDSEEAAATVKTGP